ncbi:MAG: hypothetical protein CL925_05260 [Deltaproteobacteria bacterium]|nr:hypothetical protein [Deltaproteobacteria bacterium]
MFNHFVLCAICGFIGLSLSAAGIKQLLLTHDFWSIIFPLLLNSAMMMGIALYLLQGKQGFIISKWMIHIFRGMLGFTGIVCGIYGLKYLNLGLFQTLVNLYPVITLILAALILKEAIGWKVCLAVGLSMGGIVIAFDPKLDGGIMFLFPLAVAFALAGQSIIVRYHPKDSSLTWAFYTEIIAAILALVAFLTVGNGELPLDQPFLFYGVALVDGFSIFLITHAFHGERAGRIAPLAYLSIVSGAFFGFIFFHETLHWEMLFAALLIISCGIYALREAERCVSLKAHG